MSKRSDVWCKYYWVLMNKGAEAIAEKVSCYASYLMDQELIFVFGERSNEPA